ncbi:MAG TPA: hypothetical protein VMT00_10575 [Thermoanaerobaculia bacterium]|nr:hypothetical protein [Thermoanaerobaculia bacterium]
MKSARLVLSAMVTLSAVALAAQISEGDAQWTLRAEGHVGPRARTVRVDAAIDAYRNAIAASPSDLEAHWKLMRAIRFKGAYAASSDDERKRIYDEARSAGNDAMALVDRALAAKGIKSPSRAAEKEVAAAARSIAGAGEIYYWDAVNWGEWALVFGKLAAVRQGAADRIRRHSTIAMLIDPRLEGGGGAQVLGRLHHQTPRVPLLTGWASNALAVRYLREAAAAEPSNKITQVFLAEAMVANDPARRPEAIRILRSVIAAPADPAFAVEHEAARADARLLLRQWGID